MDKPSLNPGKWLLTAITWMLVVSHSLYLAAFYLARANVGRAFVGARRPVVATTGASSQAQQPKYAVVDLGTLGGDRSVATAINDHGDIVGNSETQSGRNHAFLWMRGRMRDLGTLGGPSSVASGINNSGAIIGAAQIGPGPNTTRRFLWTQGLMREVGFGNNLKSDAMAINNAGVIAGQYTGTDGYVYACYSDARGIHQLPGRTRCGGNGMCAIDDRGNIVGCVVRIESGRGSDACIWRRGRLTLLPVPLPTVWSEAAAINKRGLIVGWVEDAQMAQGHRPCMWQLGKRIIFQLLSSREGEASSINDSGIIVGESGADDKSRAVAWADGSQLDLNSAISPFEHWTLEGANCINSRGQIVGWGKHHGHRRAFLLTPVRG
jgi:probable HAF family extracellular repeat protein